MKTYAIGDVHGCFDTLEQLLQQIPNKSRLVFIGDIVNRGPNLLKPSVPSCVWETALSVCSGTTSSIF